MRLIVTLLIATLPLMAACSKPAAPSESTASAPETAPVPSPAPTLTADQKKALLAQLPTAYQSADLDNGEAKFAICKTCHSTAQGGGNMTGPNLYGVFGRKAGTAPGYAYSDGLKALGVTWDADKISQWIANPRGMVAGTKMTYIGMQNAKDRTDLVAYLKTATSPAPGS